MSTRVRDVRAFLVTETNVEPVNDFLAELACGGVSDADIAVQVLPAPASATVTFVAVITYTDRAARGHEPAAPAAATVTHRADPVRIQGSQWRRGDDAGQSRIPMGNPVVLPSRLAERRMP